MWISRERYERLITRIKDAEERLSHSEYRERHLNDLIWDMRAQNKDNEEDNVEEEKEMTYKWAIFYKDGSVRIIYACDYNWDDDNETLSFGDEDDNPVACFRLDSIDGVAMVCDHTPIGIKEPLAQLPAPEVKEVEIPAKPIIINDPVKTPEWFPSPWTPSDPWWKQPQVTWSNADTKPLAERGTE